MKKLNLDYLDNVQAYCDKVAYQKEFGYNEQDGQFDDTPFGRIGAQLDVISACIEEIREIYDNAVMSIGKSV